MDCAIWGTAAHKNINILQRLQSGGLKTCIRANRLHPTKELHDSLKVDSIRSLIRKLAANFHGTISSHTNPSISSQAAFIGRAGFCSPPSRSPWRRNAVTTMFSLLLADGPVPTLCARLSLPQTLISSLGSLIKFF
ncbi:hypothetical protein NPIL_499941 [Nephila pilipes]|uniref:Uncharacterized protein n=1 Tax=Nephila pilipes TaxID=299642 RepID=A0A8X6P2Z9_NEPPI|nr:hypothetical protein NPIL_499941 [Nephila pilipes]